MAKPFINALVGVINTANLCLAITAALLASQIPHNTVRIVQAAPQTPLNVFYVAERPNSVYEPKKLVTCLDLVTKFEGFRSKAYLDVRKIPTLGYGQTEGVKLGMVTSKSRAMNYAEKRCSENRRFVRKTVLSSLTPQQVETLSSFVYNCGQRAFLRSTLLKRLNANRAELAAQEFGKWVHCSGRILAGLVGRRETERSLFES